MACFLKDLFGGEGGAEDGVVARESAVGAVVDALVGHVEGSKETDRFTEITARDLGRLAEDVGITSVALPESEADTPYTLADVYDPELETLAQDVYQRDYVMFGYQDWTAS